MPRRAGMSTSGILCMTVHSKSWLAVIGPKKYTRAVPTTQFPASRDLRDETGCLAPARV